MFLRGLSGVVRSLAGRSSPGEAVEAGALRTPEPPGPAGVPASDLAVRLARAEHLAGFGILAAGIAHEIATLVTVADGELSVAKRRGSLGARATKHVDASLETLRQVSRLVRGMLDLSRALEFHPVASDVGEVVRRAVETLRPAIDRSRIDVTIDVESGLPPALVDPDGLCQAIVIMVKNAVEAMAGGGRLSVIAWREPAGPQDEHARLCIDVTDTGVGIAAGDLPRLFAPFFSTKGRSHGAGLGLHVASTIVGVHGGVIEASSQPGVGTTMCVRLPLRTAAMAARGAT